jgi:hypothetical protein
MCDPLSAIALAGSAVAAGVSYEGQQETVAAQQKANDDWVATQRAAAQAAAQKDEANRQKAQAALSTSEQALTPQNQTAVQQGAQTNLTNQMLAGSPAADNSNVSVLGGTAGADTAVTSDMASRITAAARAAQGRIKALAGITSYGGGYGDMGAAANQALSNSAEGINLASDFRKGDTATLGVTQQIQPLHYDPGSNIAGTIADKLGSLAGNAFMGSGPGKALASSLKGTA